MPWLTSLSYLKAEESFWHDYWFAPEAVYRITVVSYPTFTLSFLGAYLFAAIIGTFVSEPTWLILLAVALAGPYLAMTRAARRRRTSIGSPPAKDFLENRKKAERIAWEDVKEV